MVLLLAACFGPTDWTDARLEGACADSEPGHDAATADAIEALDRVNCYRRLAGLEVAVLDPQLDAAAQAHADYMELNGELVHAETSGAPGFTGEQVWDRADAAGWTDQAGYLFLEVVAAGPEPAGAVDLWVDSVYHRTPFMGPEWVAGGFGYAGTFAAMAVVEPYPQSADVAVAYPVNGQLGVPHTFDSDTESPDPAPDHGLVGYPVTVSVSSTSPDPGLQLLRGELRGPEGTVDVIALDPTNDEWLFDMVALVPIEPLTPGAAYDAELEIAWNGRQETLAIHFETAQ